ncbi:MAG: heme o synthase, partial [Alphaproteobacteria bacterium]
WVYMATCGLLGGYFIFLNHKLLKAEEPTAYALKSFMFSIAYLFLVFTALAFDGLVRLLGIQL